MTDTELAPFAERFADAEFELTNEEDNLYVAEATAPFEEGDAVALWDLHNGKWAFGDNNPWFFFPEAVARDFLERGMTADAVFKALQDSFARRFALR